MNKKFNVICLIFLLSIISGSIIVNAQDPNLNPPSLTISSSGTEALVQWQRNVSQVASFDQELKLIAKILASIADKDKNSKVVKIDEYFDDGQVIEIIGESTIGKAFLDGKISQLDFFLQLAFNPLTRGPNTSVNGECEHDRGDNCENCPACLCYPNERCDPSNLNSNKRGCVIFYAPTHSHLLGYEYVCDEGYEWNSDLTECTPFGKSNVNTEGVDRESREKEFDKWLTE